MTRTPTSPLPDDRPARRALSRWLPKTVMLVPLLAAPLDAMASPDTLRTAVSLPQASLMAEDGGRTVIAHQAERLMIPASTMKIVTALAAIQRWGLDHRFHTDFYRTKDGWLWVKGYGDPYLVSQELEAVVFGLKQHGIRSITGIGTDDGFFGPDVEISGRSSSNNPYDAPVTALAANFNTVNVSRSGGEIHSAEPQTPLTPLARSLVSRVAPTESRINLKERELGARYFGELLAAKLAAAGIETGDGLRNGPVPAGAERIYRHHNGRDLRHVLAAMLKYSNNFIANDLFLLLGDRGDGQPVSMGRAQSYATAWVQQRFGWHDFRIEDGAGLSRENRLSAHQLLDAVKAFAAYRDLLPEHGAQVVAKTGTLTGVSCYAGFVQRHGRWEPFSLMINQPVPPDFRQRVADALAHADEFTGLCAGASC